MKKYDDKGETDGNARNLRDRLSDIVTKGIGKKTGCSVEKLDVQRFLKNTEVRARS